MQKTRPLFSLGLAAFGVIVVVIGFVLVNQAWGKEEITARPGSSNAREVRLWAAGQGLQVNTRGRIQADIMEKYEAAH